MMKYVSGYEGLYSVTDQGEVISHRINSALSQSHDKKGYRLVSLCKKGISKTRRVHRLIAEAFIPCNDLSLQINHKNGITNDNRLINLEWCTHSENNKHAYAMLGRRPNMLGRIGSDNPNSKPVIQYDLDMRLIKKYESVTQASSETGVSIFAISYIARGITKSPRKFQWRYRDGK